MPRRSPRRRRRTRSRTRGSPPRSPSAARPTTRPPRGRDPGAAGRERAARSGLDLLGLALRAGRLEVGTNAVKEAARRGELHAAVLADDAGDNARGRVLPLLRANGVPVVTCASTADLGRAVGRSRLVVAGVTDAGFAGRILAALPPMSRTEREQKN